MGRNILIGVDIGGTFTDLVLGEENSERVHKVKVLTTPDDPVRGVMEAVGEGLRLANAAPGDVKRFVHATTLATNMVIERKGARVAYVATKGFGDVFEIGKRTATPLESYDILFVRNPPLVPRDMVFELPERMNVNGEAITALTEDAAHALAKSIAELRPDAVAVCLLHAYANGAHEAMFGDILRSYLPDCYIALSSEVWPEMAEYERGATTLVSAYVGPMLSGYVRRLDQQLKEAGLTCALQIMQSSGGIMAASDVTRRAAYTLESGPAAGVISSARLGEHCGYPNIISFDMGGTTAKAGLVERGEPHITYNFRVGSSASAGGHGGGGEPIRLPVIDLAEVGAGGGSLARVDAGGFLNVGPDSAGADPGPACYGRGGERPTVTDANLVLGYLDPDFFLGGQMKLDVERAIEAIRTHVGEPLGLGELEAAWRIHELANTAMGTAIRMVTVQRGIDPREFGLVAFGGAGPLHAVHLAEEFGIRTILVPSMSGVRSAFGLLESDLSYDFIRTSLTSTANPDLGLLNESFVILEERARADTASDELELQRFLEIRFTQQSLRLRIRIPDGTVTGEAVARAEADFRDEYAQMSSIRSTDSCQIMNCWVEALGRMPRPALPRMAKGDGNVARARKGARRAYFHVKEGYADTDVYDRSRLLPGDKIPGPALIEEPESTTVLPPGYSLKVDEHLNVVIARD